MKKLLIGLTLLASMSSFANTSSYDVKGFTKLEFSKLAIAIKSETRNLEDVRILSLKSSVLNYTRAPFEFFGAYDANDNNDQDWLVLEFSTKINDSVEVIKCEVTLFKDRENISLSDCMNSRVELANDYIKIPFNELGIERVNTRSVID